MIMLKKLATEYFNYFSKKSITEIEKALSENVTLNDWNISCSGKSEVIGAIKSIFDSVDTIDVKSTNIYCCKDVVIAELEIVINNSIVELVVDIITFDINNKIASIRAYKC
jgi:hypothetical protein